MAWPRFERGHRGPVDWNARGGVQIIRDRLVSDHDDRVNQVRFGPTRGKECVEHRITRMSPIHSRLMHEARKRIEFRVKARLAAADLEDLRVRQACFFANHRVRGETVLAAVDFADDQIYNFTCFAGDAAFSVLKRQIVNERVIRMRHRRVKVGHEAETLLQLVKDRLIGWRNFVAGWDVERCHSGAADQRG